MKTLPSLVLLISLSLSLPAEPPTEEVGQLLEKSRAALANGDAKTAIEFAEQATAAAPTYAEAHLQLGSALGRRIGEVSFMQQAMLSGRLRSAFEKTVELDPNNLGGRIGLVRYYMNAPSIAGGSRTRAESEAEQLHQRHPFLGTMERAAIAEKFEDFESAAAHYQEATRLQPEQARPHYHLGVVQERLGQAAEARAHYERALKLDPAHKEATAALERMGAAITP